MTLKRAAIYVRVSRAREDMISPELQRTHCERWARDNGYEIVQIYEDLNISGRKFHNRKVGKMIEEAEEGQYEVVIVWKYSRWGRDLLESALYEHNLNAAGGRLVSATEPMDTTTPAGRLNKTLVMAVAQFQAEELAAGWKDVGRRRLTLGLPHNSNPRFGYVWNKEAPVALPDGKVIYGAYEVDPETGPLLSRAYDDYVQGRSMRAITLDWRAQGVKTVKGHLYTVGSLRQTLDSGFAAGYIRTRKDLKKSPLGMENWDYQGGAHMPVITQEIWEAYKAKRRRKGPGQKVKKTYRLRGMAYCWGCGQRMVYSDLRLLCTDQHGVCPDRVAIRLPKAERLVLAWLEANARGGESISVDTAKHMKAQQASSDATRLQRELDRLLERQAKLLDLYLNDDIPKARYQEKDGEMVEDIAEVRARLSEATRSSTVLAMPNLAAVEALKAAWADMDVDLLNEALKSVITRIWVKPGYGKDRLLVVTVWEEDARFLATRKANLKVVQGTA